MGGGVRDRKIGGRSAETSRDLHLAVVPVAQVADHHDLAGREVGGLVGLEASTLPPVALVLLGQNWVRFLDARVASHLGEVEYRVDQHPAVVEVVAP
jgi:hypothetical protein